VLAENRKQGRMKRDVQESIHVVAMIPVDAPNVVLGCRLVVDYHKMRLKPAEITTGVFK
jgi:hypothetical protein